MGQIAKALERANYLKDLAENIYQYKKYRKLQEMNEALSGKFQELMNYYKDYLAREKNLEQIPPPPTDEQNTLVPEKTPTEQQPTQQPATEQPTTTQQPTTQPTTQSTQPQEGGSFDINISGDKITAKDKRVKSELDNLKMMFSDYYRKQNEILQHALRLNSFITEALGLINSPYLDNNERNYYASQINAMSNQFTNLLNMLREQNKIMQYNTGDSHIFAFGDKMVRVPETKFNIANVGEDVYLVGSGQGEVELNRIFRGNELKKEEERQKELEARRKEIKKLTEDLQKNYSEATGKFERDYRRFSNIIPATFYSPSIKNLLVESKVVDSKGKTRTELKSIDDIILENNLIKSDAYGQGQAIEDIDGIISNIAYYGRNIFNNLGYIDNNDVTFHSITGIPISLKIGDKVINASSILDNNIISEIAKNIIDKGNRTNKNINLYEEVESYASRIIDSINNALFGGENVFDQHAKSYLTRYYYVSLIGNRNNYFRNNTDNEKQ